VTREHLAVSRFGATEWILSVLLAVTWGSSFLLIDIAIEHLDTRVVPFGRSLAGAVALAFFPAARDAIPRRDWPRIAILGLVWMALPFWLFPLAEKTVASSVAGMMNGGLPVVMAAVTALWVRRLPSVRRIGAIVLGFVGIVVVAWPAIQTDTTSGDSIADLRGVLFLAGALSCYAVGANVARPLQAQYAPARLLMRVQIAATLWTLPFAADGASSSDFTWSSVLAVVGLGVVGTGIAFVVFGTLLERTGLTRAMIPTYFTPIVGLVLGTLFNNETIALVSVAGLLVVIASAWMTSKPDERDVTLSDATAAR
jgi:drug/metabolite transporter (DMT)-like permease